MKINATTSRGALKGAPPRGMALWGVPLALFFLILVLATVPLAAEGTAYLQVRQILDRQEIYVVDTGAPDTTTLSLTVEGMGPAERFPIDFILVIDRSATADLSVARRVAFELISKLSPQDRLGIVSYATTARLDAPLRGDRARLKAVIADLEKGGRSALGDALHLARRELLQNGRDDALPAMILLTDGQNNTGREPEPEGEVARGAGIKIVPIGVGHLINRGLLEGFAVKTGGRFFPRPIATVAEEIVNLLTVTVVARNVQVEKILPVEIVYVEASPAPTRVLGNHDGTTSLIWDLASLAIGEQWQAVIVLAAKVEGEWPIGQGSTIEYSDFRGVRRTILLPVRTITAIVPPPPPVPNIRPVAEFEYAPDSPNTTDMVEFTDRSTDQDGYIVSWAWDFGDGATSDEENPQRRFSRSGDYIVTLVVTDNEGYLSAPMELTVTVANKPPIAMFTLEPARPRVAVETLFDASKSYDVDGRVVSFAWDFDGDGMFDLTTASPTAAHTFLKVGEVTVGLKVTDDEGGVGTIERAVEVLPSVNAVRTIETCLPLDETIAGGIVTVTVTITANTEIHGLTLREELPAGWTFAAIDNSSATLRKDENTITWLFFETLINGDRRVIQYTLIAPAGSAAAETMTKPLTGLVQSSSPRLSRMVLGDDRVALIPILPIPVVISRWDSNLGRIDLCLPEQIAFDQIQFAISLWLTGDVVPHTGEQVITLDVIRDLIAYWLTGRSVHEPLP